MWALITVYSGTGAAPDRLFAIRHSMFRHLPEACSELTRLRQRGGDQLLIS
jgi:hypothetical protein